METLTNSKNYSKIIDGENYNHIMTNQHIYIQEADSIMLGIIQQAITTPLLQKEVVEVGCGPARFLRELVKLDNINLTGIDTDKNFLEYAEQITEGKCNIVNEDIAYYKHNKPIDIICSHGLHHHIPKDEVTLYLNNLYDNLADGGLYIIVDDFLPEYIDNAEREIKVVIWYSYVIAKALNRQYDYLAQEEAKTMLDDINEGRANKTFKNYDLIADVLELAPKILTNVKNSDFAEAEKLAIDFLRTTLPQNDQIDITDNNHLSREDFKICHSIFTKELENTKFKIIDKINVGNVDKIGGMSVYVLKK
jgi:SAM-dependent methyltransferase